MKNIALQSAVAVLFIAVARIVRVVEGYGPFLDKPRDPTTVALSQCANFTWTFRPRTEDHIVYVSFGKWSSPGYIGKKLLVSKPNGQSDIRPTYAKKLRWVGDLGNSTASVEMCNITKEDQMTYGIHIELGLEKNPMTGYFRLDIATKSRPTTTSPTITTTQTASTAEERKHAHNDVDSTDFGSRRNRIFIMTSAAIVVLLAAAVLSLTLFIRKRGTFQQKDLQTKADRSCVI